MFSVVDIKFMFDSFQSTLSASLREAREGAERGIGEARALKAALLAAAARVDALHTLQCKTAAHVSTHRANWYIFLMDI